MINLYNLFTTDVPNTKNILIANYPHNIAIFSEKNHIIVAPQALQLRLDEIEKCSSQRKIKINANKTLANNTSHTDICSKKLYLIHHVLYLGL